MNDIPFTFGIITNAQNGVNEHLPQAVQSIRELHLPEYEIIIVGSRDQIIKHEILKPDDRLKVIDFIEAPKAWITKKKNLITQFSKYENIVYQHDYIIYDRDWYEGFKRYGDNFKACMTQIKNQDGTRFRDWVIFPWHHCTSGKLANQTKKLWEYAEIENNESMIPYTENRFNKFQYFSGSYWVAKKSIMLEIPLDENLFWGDGEDCDFSQKFTSKYEFSMNEFSTVHLLKYKQDAFCLIKPENYKKALEFLNL